MEIGLGGNNLSSQACAFKESSGAKSAQASKGVHLVYRIRIGNRRTRSIRAKIFLSSPDSTDLQRINNNKNDKLAAAANIVSVSDTLVCRGCTRAVEDPFTTIPFGKCFFWGCAPAYNLTGLLLLNRRPTHLFPCKKQAMLLNCVLVR